MIQFNNLRKLLRHAVFILAAAFAAVSPVRGQTQVSARPVVQQQTLASAQSCSSTPTTYLINNQSQSFHYVTYFTSGSPTSLKLFIQGTSDGTNFFQISDTATDPASGQITAYGYFPLVNVSVACTGGTSPTITIQYSGTPQSASQSFTQLDSGIYQKVIAQAASTGTTTSTTFLTPYGNSAGWLVAQAAGTGFGIGGTLMVSYSDQCNNTSYISNVALAGPFALTAGSTVPQAFAVPPFPTCGVVVTFTHGSGASGTYSAEYNFTKPGAALVPAQVKHIATAATTSVKSGPGSLASIVVNTPAAGETISVYDVAAAACTGTPGNLRATITLSATSDIPLALPYDMQMSLGVCVITSSTADLTIMFN
jgi:hypothetical protein